MGVGIIASSVVEDLFIPGVDLLFEDFENFLDAPWAINSTPGFLLAGRNKRSAEINSISDRLDYLLGANASADLTIGFAWRTPVIQTSGHNVMGFYADAGATAHNQLNVSGSASAGGEGRVRIVSGTGTTLGATDAGTVVANTWYYIEYQTHLADAPDGWAKVRIDGVEVLSLTGIDTKNGGTAAVYESIRLMNPSASSGGINYYDDFYVNVGGSFKGDIGDQTVTNDVLLDPLENFTAAPWTTTGAASIVAARTNNGAQIAGSSSNLATFTIPSGDEDQTMIVGVAFRWTDGNSLAREVFRLMSDAGVTDHTRVTVNTSGSILVTRATTTIVTAAVSLVANTWYYIELMVTLGDTAAGNGLPPGLVELRLNGSTVGSNNAVDTKNAGTKPRYDTLTIGPRITGATHQYDDLYVVRGNGAFKGSITL